MSSLSKHAHLTVRLIGALALFSASMAQAVQLPASNPLLANPSSYDNLWAYSAYDASSSVISSYTDYATTSADYAPATHRGYISGEGGTAYTTYDSWNGGTGTDYKAVHVFGTWIVSDVDQTLSLLFSGDDGHSLFVDNSFVSGAGFGVNGTANLALTAGTAVYLELVGFNDSGTWGFNIQDQAGNQLIEQVNGIRMNALGDFAEATVPSPAPAMLLISGLLVWRRVKERQLSQEN